MSGDDFLSADKPVPAGLAVQTATECIGLLIELITEGELEAVRAVVPRLRELDIKINVVLHWCDQHRAA